jgi:single-strand DNA-binding protein
VYVEGNIELRIYDDPKTGMTKRLHEIAVRQNGMPIISFASRDLQWISCSMLPQGVVNVFA